MQRPKGLKVHLIVHSRNVKWPSLVGAREGRGDCEN